MILTKKFALLIAASAALPWITGGQLLAVEMRGTGSDVMALAESGGTFTGIAPNGGLIRSVDGGSAFVPVLPSNGSAPAEALLAVAASGSIQVAAGVDGVIFRSVDSGAGWTDVTPGPAILGDLKGLATNGAGNWLAVGSDNFKPAVFASANNGASWTAVATPSAAQGDFHAVVWEPVSSSWLIVGSDGFGGSSYRLTPPATWSHLVLPAGAEMLNSIAADGSGNILAVGDFGGMYALSSGSNTYSVVGAGSVSEDLYAVTAAGTGNWWVGGQSQVLIHVAGASAYPMGSPVPGSAINSILTDDNGDLMLSGIALDFDAFAPVGVPLDFGNTADLGDGWKLSPWLGTFYDQLLDAPDRSWIYHLEHGWWWLDTRLAAANSLFIYDLALDEWFSTNTDQYPYLYAYNEGWLYFHEDSVNPRQFFHFGLREWITK